MVHKKNNTDLFIIVGAGFSGAVFAERVTRLLGCRCIVVERRAHIAGNAYDAYDKNGILLHKYGPHYFRTNSDDVISYLSNFTEWHPVKYQVLSFSQNRLWSFPVNLLTFEQFVGREATQEEFSEWLSRKRVPILKPKNSEEAVISQVGWEFYDLFFKNYTLKQWKRHPRDLDASVCARIPFRTNRDDRYLTEDFQALPSNGYTYLIQKILDHPLIDVQLNTDYRNIRDKYPGAVVVYTGMIDEYYDFCFGHLPYRSLRFEEETFNTEYYQPVMQVNYPNDFDYTRIVEIKHATGQKSPLTTIVKEFPDDYIYGKEAYYPIPAPDTALLFNKYWELAQKEQNVIFTGRLAKYKYFNMDQVIAASINEVNKYALSVGINLSKQSLWGVS